MSDFGHAKSRHYFAHSKLILAVQIILVLTLQCFQLQILNNLVSVCLRRHNYYLFLFFENIAYW